MQRWKKEAVKRIEGAWAAFGAVAGPFSLSATRVRFPGAASKNGLNSVVQIRELLATPLGPNELGPPVLHRFAGVIRDFRSQCGNRTGVARSFPF